MLGGKEPPYLGGPNTAAEFNIPGLPSSLAGGFNTQIIGGFSNPTLGRQATNPQFQNPTSFNPKLNYSMVKGRHSIKVGYEFLAIRTEVLDINPLYGPTPIPAASASPPPRSAAARPLPIPPVTIWPTSTSVCPTPSRWATTSPPISGST